MSELIDAGRLNLTLHPGATFRATWVWGDDLQRPFNLTGYEARMQIRAKATDEDALVSLSTEPGGGLTIDAPVGVIKALITAEQTSALASGVAVYDLYVKEPNGDVRKLLYGDVTVTRRVTQWQP